jgi:FkbM family methyltransferase
MTNLMTKIIKYACRRLGYDFIRHTVYFSEAARFATMLQYHRVNLVLDVGANIGQFAGDLRNKYGYTGRLVSFEPMKAAHDELCKSAIKDQLWTVAPRAAIGATAGEVEINVAANSVSSSILPMLDRHAAVAPESRYKDVEKVPMRTLDSIALDYITSDSVAFLKIDTQGYEHYVLEGAKQILSKAVGIQLELSLLELYAGQRLMPEMVKFLGDAGFDLWALSPAFVEPNTGRILQVDGIFFRR